MEVPGTPLKLRSITASFLLEARTVKIASDHFTGFRWLIKLDFTYVPAHYVRSCSGTLGRQWGLGNKATSAISAFQTRML